jgi:hypothetical protein
VSQSCLFVPRAAFSSSFRLSIPALSLWVHCGRRCSHAQRATLLRRHRPKSIHQRVSAILAPSHVMAIILLLSCSVDGTSFAIAAPHVCRKHRHAHYAAILGQVRRASTRRRQQRETGTTTTSKTSFAVVGKNMTRIRRRAQCSSA